MKWTDVMGLLGGLALFLYGMQMMSQGLENAAGNKMKQILGKLTSNRFLGVVVGAVITAVIQSSSATTVMVVGFVNSGLMTLTQAIWIIMGANIGTTITGQLIALDVGALAPFIAFVGVAILVFLKNEKIHPIGHIVAGLGILFIGMDMMSASMEPLSDSTEFIRLLTRFENPILGILAGMIFTAIIQSSSASVGILQALAAGGVVTLDSAAFILFGQNIGTCITALLAAIGANRNAKRTTVVHFSFNIIGTFLFAILCVVTPLIHWMQSISPDNVPAQIANLHTLFNIVTTILLLPFGQVLATIAKKILPDRERAKGWQQGMLPHMQNSARDMLGQSAISTEETKKELYQMLHLAEQNVHHAFEVFIHNDKELFQTIVSQEEQVDQMNDKITCLITTAISHENTTSGSSVFSSYYAITGNIERISDHAMNIAEYSKMRKKMGVKFTKKAKKEAASLQEVCDQLFVLLYHMEEDMEVWHQKVADQEQKIDDLTKQYRDNMMERIQKKECSYQASILYSEMLTDFERIGDHALNIADEWQAIAGFESNL
ncbi:MAG: Na/Pi cotransporter family protein [Eubacterium sp.]|nr:Na/Pi cotransporter family protein [Eubacterium sp.]